MGAGASKLRTETAQKLLEEVKFTVIRGNISEVKTLASGSGTTKGVDADVADKVSEENLDSAVAFAKAFAEKTGAVCAMGLAGEIAHARLSAQDGNSTYRNYIIDAIYNMTPEQLEEGAKYEVR